jgi:hypothetical protein
MGSQVTTAAASAEYFLRGRGDRRKNRYFAIPENH